jgi:ADP-ribose pyrophosphatase YjhB (NUDIX family)
MGLMIERGMRASWADRLRAAAQTGHSYATNYYDRERYEQILTVAAEMVSSLTDLSPAEIQTVWARNVGHLTPKVGVGAAIFNAEGKILLLQRPESGRWGLPVGFSEVGETPSQGIAREVREETGLIVRPIRLLGIYACQPDGLSCLHHLYNVIFCCDVEGGSLVATDEAPNADYFPRDTLPLLVAHHTRSIYDAFAARSTSWATAVFD